MAIAVADKAAIVTGAGSGINLAFARLLLENGANVLFADVALRPEAEEVVQKYSSASSSTTGRTGKSRAVFQRTDVRDWTELNRMFEVAVREFGKVDIVCPGAGIYEPAFSNFWFPPGCPESKDPVDGGRYTTLDVDLTHPIRTTQLAISHFMAQSATEQNGTKAIVHISSIAGQNPGFGTPIYVAAKHAINGFVRSLARLDEEHGIRVTAVAPGVIYTPLFYEDPVKIRAVTKDDVWVYPEEVAEAMLALVEKDSICETKDPSSASITIKGGTILEVSKDRVRDVQPFNDPGPGSLPGNTVRGYDNLEQDALTKLKEKDWGRVR